MAIHPLKTDCHFYMNYKTIHIDETDSTNRWLRNHGDDPHDQSAVDGENRPYDLVVVTDYQTAGRGCGTNTWESERGKNLLFSMLLHPVNVPAANQFILSMANALALKDTLDDYVDNIKIKWPNDIYWKDRKICGTLIETTLQGGRIKDCIIGTGINVNQQTFYSDAPNPVSLFQILGHEVKCQTVLEKVMTNTGKYMDMVTAGAWEEIRARYRSHLYRLHETHRYRFTNGDEEHCKLMTVTDDGHLELLHDNRDTYRLAFKEVQFVL